MSAAKFADAAAAPRRRRRFSLRTLLLALLTFAACGAVLWRPDPNRLKATFTYSVWDCACSPDGAWVGAGEGGGDFALWDAATGQLRHMVKGHSASIRHCGFSPDSHFFFTCSDDGTAALWDVQTGAERARFKGHKNGVNWLCVSPDGRHVLTGSDDYTVRLWDAATGVERGCYGVHCSRETPAAFAPDSKSVVLPDSVAATGNAAHVVNVNTLKTLCSFAGANACYAEFSRDGQKIVVLDFKGGGNVWHVATQQKVCTLAGKFNIYKAARFSPDGRYIAADGKDGTLFDAQTGAMIRKMENHTHDSYHSPIFSHDGKRLAGITRQGYKASIWDVESGRQIETFVTSYVVFMPDNVSALRASAADSDGGCPVGFKVNRLQPESYPWLNLPQFWIGLLFSLGLLLSWRADRRI